MSNESIKGICRFRRHWASWFCFFVMIWSFPLLSFAGTGPDETGVHVTATGTAPVSQGIIQAKQVALMLAKRQAVEKAAGMSMVVSNTPDTRSIDEKAMAALTYTIAAERITGGMYSVEIAAVVNVPEAGEELTGTAGLAVTQSATGELIDRTPYGEINWTQGYIIAYGKGEIPKGLNKEICDSMAKRAALIDAHARALELAQGVNLDGDMSVGKYVSKNSRLFYRLKGLVARVKPFEQNRENDVYSIKIKVPFYGINGVQTVFLNSYVKTGNKSIALSPTDKRIVIDARGTGLKPAMFVRIEDQSGNNIYSAQDVSRNALQNKGMVQYVTATTITQTDIQATALKADGRQNGNIVLSPADAGKLKQDGIRSALSGGNVVVITDSPVGGTEGSLPFLFAEFKRTMACIP